MDCEYDPEANVLLLTLSNEKPDFGKQSGPIITHYSEDEEPVEIEILDASETVLEFLKPILSSRKEEIKV